MAHALGELALAESGLGTQVVDELTEREVVLDLGPRVRGWLAALVLDVVPTGIVGHRVLLHRFDAVQLREAYRRRIRRALRRSRERCSTQRAGGPGAAGELALGPGVAALITVASGKEAAEHPRRLLVDL